MFDREAKARQWCKDQGWGAPTVVIENDLSPSSGKVRAASAFKRRKIRLPDGRTQWRVIRPGFQSVLDGLTARRGDGLVVPHSDRLYRDPRDLEDLIEVVEQTDAEVAAMEGSLDLKTDHGIAWARIAVTMQNQASRDTARRVTAARRRKALAGEFAGGARPFGFEADGVTIRPAEAELIVDLTRRLLTGEHLSALASELAQAGVPGMVWDGKTLREMLIKPRNAGWSVHQREVVGRGKWDPIVEPDVHQALVEKLTDPSRNSGGGREVRWLGSRLYHCGVCGEAAMTIGKNSVGHPRYLCTPVKHLGRQAVQLDAFVSAVVRARLGRPDAAELFLPPPAGVDAKRLRREATAIRSKLKQMAGERALGKLTKAEFEEAREKVQLRLVEIGADLSTVSVDSPLRSIVTADDVAATWTATPLSTQRLIIKTIMTVTVLPTGAGRRKLDPDSVRIEWND